MKVNELIEILNKLDNPNATIYMENEFGGEFIIESIQEPKHTANIVEIKLK
jgi:hypothetical protein